MTQKRALIIDDEPDIRELLEITLGRMQIQTDSAESVASAKQTHIRFTSSFLHQKYPRVILFQSEGMCAE
jgi:DNA-binding NtrC family response regulator